MFQLVKHLSVLYYFYKYFILLYCIKLYLECAQRLLRGKMGKKRGCEYRIVSYCIVRTILHRLQYRWKAQKMTQGEKRKWACTKNDYVRSICIQKGITHKQPVQMKKLPQDLSFFLCMLISHSLPSLAVAKIIFCNILAIFASKPPIIASLLQQGLWWWWSNS